MPCGSPKLTVSTPSWQRGESELEKGATATRQRTLDSYPVRYVRILERARFVDDLLEVVNQRFERVRADGHKRDGIDQRGGNEIVWIHRTVLTAVQGGAGP